MHENNWRRGIAATVLSCVSALAAAADSSNPLDTVVAGYRVEPRERIWDGSVEAVNQATVSAQTSGRVAEIFYDVDDFVEAGSTLMRFTDIEQRAALRSANAALSEAKARQIEAKNEFDRVRGLYENQTVSKARFDQARANADAAGARVDAARSALSAAQQQTDYTVVKAPYAGIVSQRHVEPGEMVRPGQPLMSGLSLRSLRVSVDVPQSLIDPIRKIGKAYIYAADKRIAGVNLTFFPIADPQSNTFRIRVDLPDDAVELYPGMFVKVGFVVGESQRLLVPAAAVVRRSELTAVYVVTDGRISLRQVRAGRRYGESVEVLSGLTAGESVATDPVQARLQMKQDRAGPVADAR